VEQPPQRTAASPTASDASCASTATAALGCATSVLYSQNSGGSPQSVQYVTMTGANDIRLEG